MQKILKEDLSSLFANGRKSSNEILGEYAAEIAIDVVKFIDANGKREFCNIAKEKSEKKPTTKDEEGFTAFYQTMYNNLCSRK